MFLIKTGLSKIRPKVPTYIVIWRVVISIDFSWAHVPSAAKPFAFLSLNSQNGLGLKQNTSQLTEPYHLFVLSNSYATVHAKP